MTDALPGSFAEPSRATGAWGAWWRGWYRLLRVVGGPLDRLALRPGFGNLVVLRVVGRRSGRERALPLGLLTVGGRRYLGHPSGDTAWTRNLRAATTATIESARIPRSRVRPVLLGSGPERDAVVRASFRQHPFPGNAMYRLAGRHVAATGIFFRLEPVDSAAAPPADPARAPPPGGRSGRHARTSRPGGPLGPSRRLDAPSTLDGLDDRRALAGNRLVRRRRRRRAPGRTTSPRERSP